MANQAQVTNPTAGRTIKAAMNIAVGFMASPVRGFSA
jgi:hypothetical protein